MVAMLFVGCASVIKPETPEETLAVAESLGSPGGVDLVLQPGFQPTRAHDHSPRVRVARHRARGRLHGPEEELRGRGEHDRYADERTTRHEPDGRGRPERRPGVQGQLPSQGQPDA